MGRQAGGIRSPGNGTGRVGIRKKLPNFAENVRRFFAGRRFSCELDGFSVLFPILLSASSSMRSRNASSGFHRVNLRYPSYHGQDCAPAARKVNALRKLRVRHHVHRGKSECFKISIPIASFRNFREEFFRFLATKNSRSSPTIAPFFRGIMIDAA